MASSFRPRYHVSVPFGWANDPNGIIKYNGKIHLFYQHYPHKTEWGPMHWNHVTTEDFVHWDQHQVALYPDHPYEVVCGCCSGSTVEKDGKLYIVYTAAQPMMQRQCLAVSEDGENFVKVPENPVETAEMLSPEIYEEDFRDPRVFKKDGIYYMITGIRYVEGGIRREEAPSMQREQTNPRFAPPEHKKEGWGNLCLLKSDDLYKWSYVGHMIYPQPEFSEEFYRLDGVYECPDYFVAPSGDEVLLSSPQNLPQLGHLYQNIHSVIFMLGHLDFETGRFHMRTIGEVDSGFDFYAAQTIEMDDGRHIMIAWKEMWDRNFPSGAAEGWAGTYTLPRELTVEGERLIQKPVREIYQFMGDPVRCSELKVKDSDAEIEGVSGNVANLKFTLTPGSAKKAGVKLMCDGEHETLLYYDREEGLIVFDRTNSGEAFSGRDGNVNVRVCEIGKKDKVEFEIFLDVSSIEAFIDGGRYTMTGNVYPDTGKAVGVKFFAEDGEAVFGEVEMRQICL